MRMYSAPATRSEPPPPNPLSNPTICGMAVIFTVRASQMPMAEPTRMPAQMRLKERMELSSSAAMMAISMPMADNMLPRRAVAGELNRFNPMMNSTPATR